MKKRIRNKVFETNSSSVHSLIISDTGMEDPSLKIIEKEAVAEYAEWVKVGKETIIYPEKAKELF